VNPLSDMRADIGELCVMQWRAGTLGSMGVTYAQMANAGMTPRIMTFFRFPLSDWVVLGLAPAHIEHWTEPEALGAFGARRARRAPGHPPRPCRSRLHLSPSFAQCVYYTIN